MREYGVTGVRHRLGNEQMSFEEKTLMAEKFVEGLSEGQAVTLMAEPDNVSDPHAIAVYMDHEGVMKKVGFIKAAETIELEPFLDEDQAAEGHVTRTDGHITFFISVDGVPDDIQPPLTLERQLPVPPFDQNVFLTTTDDEQRLKVLMHRVKRLGMPVKENIRQLLGVMSQYPPLASMTLCHEDDLWRADMYRRMTEIWNQREALGLTDEECKSVEELRHTIREADADFTCHEGNFLVDVMMRHLEQLRHSAAQEHGLFERFDRYHLNMPMEKADKEMVEQERERLTEWMKGLKWIELRDFTMRDDFAKRLNYLKLSRREIYDLSAVMLLMERMDERLTEKPKKEAAVEKNYFAPMKNLQVFLMKDCQPLHTKKYSERWMEKMVEALMETEHREYIADEWKNKKRRLQVCACLLGAVVKACKISGSFESIAKVINARKGTKVKDSSFAKYMGMGEGQPYYDWLVQYVAEH